MNEQRWWRAAKGMAHAATLEFVNQAEQDLGDIFERHFLLECLYDPNNPDAEDSGEQFDHVTENVIASNVDTVAAVIATTDIRARFMTDGADWGQRRRARHLEWYTEEVATLLKVKQRCRSAFKECAKKGNGLVKVHTVLDEVRVEHVLIENIVVPEEETRDGRRPTQLHQWEYVDADELIARFPGAKSEIERARDNGSRRRTGRTRHSHLVSNDVECLWSYRLPIGQKGKKGYRAGRVVLAIDGQDLVDEKYEDDCFPFAMMVWSERVGSFYAISGAERIAGIQRALNRRNWQIERALDQAALPTTYVRPADANLAVKSSRVGSVAVVRGDYPVTVTPQAVNTETYKSRLDLRDAASEEFGQSRMATHAAKPAGLDSGIALREYKDQTTQRFAPQEQGFEQLVLDALWLVIACCKKLGTKAPVVQRHSRFGKRKLAWSEVDMRDAKVQIAAASSLNRTPAGRLQAVIEYAQAGIISQDEARRLLQHPDLERALSLYTAALESIEHDLDEIADGGIVLPEPYTNLRMAVWRAQAEYLQWRDDGAPEDVLENLRQYIVIAAWKIVQMQQPAANANAGPMAADPMAGGSDLAATGGDMPPMPEGPPVGAAPTPAFAAQAMQLRAS